MCLDFCCPSFEPKYYQPTPQYVPVPRVVFENQRQRVYNKPMRLVPSFFDDVVNTSFPMPPTVNGRVIPKNGLNNINALPLNGRINLPSPSRRDPLSVPAGERVAREIFRAPVIAPGHSNIGSGRIARNPILRNS